MLAASLRLPPFEELRDLLVVGPIHWEYPVYWPNNRHIQVCSRYRVTGHEYYLLVTETLLLLSTLTSGA